MNSPTPTASARLRVGACAIAILTAAMRLTAQTSPPVIAGVSASATTVTVGNPVTITVDASGTGPLTYLWRFNRNLLFSNGDLRTLTFLSATPSRAGTYTAAVTNAAGTSVSPSLELTVSAAPALRTVTRDPAPPAEILAATRVAFSVNAAGAPPLSYAWRRNGTNIPDATDATYVVATAGPAHEGNYDVVVRNSAGTVVSSSLPLVLSAVPVAPVITTLGVGGRVFLGSNVTLSPVVGGSGPLTYQWWRDGAPIPGATAATFAIPNIQPLNFGDYRLVVTNPAGTTISPIMMVDPVVFVPFLITAQPVAQSATPGPGKSVSFNVSATGPGALTYQWSLNGSSLPGETRSQLVVAVTDARVAGDYSVTVSIGPQRLTSTPALLTVLAPPIITTQPVGFTGLIGKPVTFTTAAIGSTPITFQWFKDGVPVPGATSATLALASLQPGDAGAYTAAVTNPSGTTRSSVATLAVVASLDPPVITAQPQSLTTTRSGTAAVEVTVKGTEPFIYQWYFNGNPTGGNSPTLRMADVPAAFGGTFWVVVSNPAGTVQSDKVTITVVGELAILKQPTPQTVNSGGAATFTVTAIGGGPIAYQWFHGSAPVLGATNATLVVGNVNIVSAGTYFVQVSSGIAPPLQRATSTVVALTLNGTPQPPVIDIPPQGQTVAEGATATFFVEARNADAAGFRYQWRRDSVNLPGATAATLTLTKVAPAAGGSYTVVVTNDVGTVTSSPATLTVSPTPPQFAPQVTRQPADALVGSGRPATFEVGVTGTPPFLFQWQKDGFLVAGATASALDISRTASADAGNYTVIVTNAVGAATSRPATLAIIPLHKITTQPADTPFNVGATATLTVGVNDARLVSYQWYHNQVMLEGATSGTLVIPNATARNAGFYYAFATNPAGSIVTDIAALYLAAPGSLPPATITAQPADAAVAAGALVTLSVAATATGLGSGTLAYQWFRDGAPLPGATAATLVLPAAAAADAGAYTVVITNNAGSTTSRAAQLTVADSRIINLSVRAKLAPDRALITGFVMGGGEKSVLLRASGPALQPFFPADTPVAGDPALNLYDATSTLVQTNDNWGGTPVLTASFASVGAFAWSPASKDAALVRPVNGPYTAHVAVTTAGIGLVEIYDLGAGSSARLINVSARYQVTPGDGALSAGFVIAGNTEKNLLIRGIGPALQDLFGIPGVLADPKVEIFRADGTKLAENDNWDAALAPVFTQVGAFAPKAGSKDAALTVRLAPGAYSAQISGVGASAGDALVEVYEVP